MVLVRRLLTDPPRPVVKVRILRSIRVSVSLGDTEKVPERNEMRAARTAQHQQKKSVSTWVVGTVSLEIWCSWQYAGYGETVWCSELLWAHSA